MASAGLETRILILSAPWWTEGVGYGSYPKSTYEPSPTALADFATAAATRYSGSFEGLPRVRYWSIWNEPNLSAFLNPQTVNGKPFAPGWYRAMLNAAADAIHSVHADNVVVAGETAPFWNAKAPQMAPFTFMEQVLCLGEKTVRDKASGKTKLVYKPTCGQRAKFDVWAHHPYTEGGPSLHAAVHGDASLGDLPRMRAVLNAAIAANHVVSKQKIRFWVTEFSWDTDPPDPKGVPPQLEARWIPLALYGAWKAGVSNFTWALLRDFSMSESYMQGGLYYRSDSGISSDTAKPALQAFRFPFIALREPKHKVQLWGRTPTSASATVAIERKSGAGWKRVETLEANRYGIFESRISEPKNTAYLRARLVGSSDASITFSLKAPSQTWTGCVFGTCV